MQLLANLNMPRTIKRVYFSQSSTNTSYVRMLNLRKNRVPSEISFSLLLFLFQLLFPLQINSYDPVDNYAVSCGYSGNISIYGRTWVGDTDTKLFSTIEPQPSSQVLTPKPVLPPGSTFPFDSARVSHSNFTYSFPLTIKGPKFLRLHFYPTSYGDFEPSNAFFSVKVNNFTLLKDFNPSLWLNNTEEEEEETISREYCVNVLSGETLDVNFIPSTNHSDSYAFINSIEVVSMPTFLYFNDSNEEFQVSNYQALETLYRVRVGQQHIPPGNDNGMFREWDNDFPRYLEKEYPYSISGGYNGLKLNYRNNTVPNYTAPEEVYLNGRSYGMTANTDYNVTWKFVVHSQFHYMVRLHFCEYDLHVKQKGDRVFMIFIADNLVEPNADVIEWSGGFNLVPVHRDYDVEFQPGSPEKLNLSIKLQRLPDKIMTTYHDILLNGIEIFKISDSSDNLAEPNPDLVQSSPQLTQSSKSSKPIIIIVAAAVVSGLVLASVVGAIFFQRRRRRANEMDENSLKSKKTEEGSSLPSHLCRYFTIAEIRAATNNFDDVFIIGIGGFGNVYKGYIDESTPVAIKRLKPGSQQGANEFMNEIELLSQLRHIHLVSLIGYCNDGLEMILVYDFMQRGTLREYLYHSDNPPLSWKQRLEILLGAARGLHYLHEGAKHNIIHRDVKSTNILLDEKWVAKVSDFGLSKVGPTGTSTTHVSTVVKGSLGYLDPEYYKRQRLTLKSDVYSFGVVLLEVLCGRPPLVRTLDKREANLVDWVQRCYGKGEMEKTVDPLLKDFMTAEYLKCYSQLAMSCLLEDGNQRPSMSDVVGALEFALQLVENEKDGNFNMGIKEMGNTEQRPQFMPVDEGSDVHFTSTDDNTGSQTSKVTTVSADSDEQPLVSATVFSEIGYPTAR